MPFLWLHIIVFSSRFFSFLPCLYLPVIFILNFILVYLAVPLPNPTDSPLLTFIFLLCTTLPRARYICQPVVFLDLRDSLQVSVQRENTISFFLNCNSFQWQSPQLQFAIFVTVLPLDETNFLSVCHVHVNHNVDCIHGNFICKYIHLGIPLRNCVKVPIWLSKMTSVLQDFEAFLVSSN